MGSINGSLIETLVTVKGKLVSGCDPNWNKIKIGREYNFDLLVL
jgi:hypothetical protein